TREVVIVYPKKDMTSDALKSKLKTDIDFTSIKNIGINGVKKIRNNGLAIECTDRQQCLRLQDKINEDMAEECTASLPKKRNPRLIIYGLHNDIDTERPTDDQLKQQM